MRARTLALVTLFAGCAAYNDQCVALVDNPNERVSFIGKELWLDKPNARHAPNPLGEAVTDGFVWVYKDSTPVDFAVINGGSLRADGLCVSHSILPVGPLSNGVLNEIMLFENQMISVDLTEQEVIDMFEHSADRLIVAPNPIPASPAGQFLQVSQEVDLSIDCSQPTGSRITRVSIKGQPLQRPGRPIDQVKYRMALSTYLAGGGDGYTMLANKNLDPSRNALAAPRFGGVDANIATQFLLQSTYNQTVDQGLKPNSRIHFTNCSVPGRPAN
jgi:2',3'-cyclic-nucleotide 2'-phosphodiesterase (5'-nucleotidase family)